MEQDVRIQILVKIGKSLKILTMERQWFIQTRKSP